MLLWLAMASAPRAGLEPASPPTELAESASAGQQPSDVVEFAKSNNLSHKLDLFQRASVLVESGASAEEVVELSESEVTALQQEKDHKWTQPWPLYLVITACSTAAIEQGWSQTGMNGANLYFPKDLGVDGGSSRDAYIVGSINSAIYLSTAVLGAWVSGPLNNRAGRRGALFVGSLTCLLSTAASGLSQSWGQLLACRLVLGVGLGINASTAAVYAAECSPAPIRGGLAVSWQMSCAFGIFLGFAGNIAMYGHGWSTWRLQLALALLPTLPILFVLYLAPESPAWYIKKSCRYDLAFQSLRRLRKTELQAARDVYATYLQDQARGQVWGAKSPFLKQLTELFTVPRIRRATLAACVVMLSQQLCGINIVSFYSSIIFADAGFSPLGALFASCVFGFINFVGAIPAIWTMDTLGRRALLLITLPPMALTMLATSFSFGIPEDSPAHFILLATLIYLFCAEYSPGMGPVPNTYSAEVFPLSHREIGMSMAVATTNVWASLLSVTFPRILASLKPQGAFFLYAVLNLLAATLVFFFVPETRQRTLEGLDEVFSVPTWRFIRYQTTDFLPWFFKFYVCRQRSAELPAIVLSDEYRELGQNDEVDIGAGPSL